MIRKIVFVFLLTILAVPYQSILRQPVAISQKSQENVQAKLDPANLLSGSIDLPFASARNLNINVEDIFDTQLITLTTNGFDPTVITITVGTEVEWYNATNQTHILMSGEPHTIHLPFLFSQPGSNPIESTKNIFQTLSIKSEEFGGTILPDSRLNHTFSSVGEYPYCLLTAHKICGRVVVVSNLPPDPADTAPPLDQTVATDLFSATEFLYTGENPIQTDVEPGVITPTRVAVLRGRVLDKANIPLSGVTVSIHEHPEFGKTISRLDGMFDIVVNGGGQLTMLFELGEYLPVQRKIVPPWRDYAWIEDVVLIPYDNEATVIDFSEPMQVARGSLITDTEGSRRATLLFPQNASIEMVFPDGNSRKISSTSLTVRATEYTVGENGPEAMPGELPQNVGYTYAVDLSIDEAGVSGAIGVLFDQPVFFYVENFLDFPIGGIVPAGYYDYEMAAWIPSDNGVVVGILGVDGNRAVLDIDGTGIPASEEALALMGISDIERERLAELYGAGQSLWRVPVQHFSPWDFNWPWAPPTDASAPNQPYPEADDPDDDPCKENGSIIECQNQILGQKVDITSTPFNLNYRSDRVDGRTAANQLTVFLSGDTLPESVIRIELIINIAGQSFSQSFSPLLYLSTVYNWDGKDAYGRTLQGIQPATVRIGYVYTGIYQEPAELSQSFAQYSGIPITGGDITRQELIIWQEHIVYIGGWDFLGQGLGGWTLNIQHTYDPMDQTIYFGNGERRSVEDSLNQIIMTVAGDGETVNTGDGGQAVDAGLSLPKGVAWGPDGNLYIAASHRVRKIDTDGVITTVAGTGIKCNFPYEPCGDGGLALSAKISSPWKIAVGPDGSLYIPEWTGHRVRRVDPNGIITTVAGNGYVGYSGDGGLAVDAQLNNPTSVAITDDGRLFIVDSGNNRIRQVSTNGIITTIAGNGENCLSLEPCGDGGPATMASIDGMQAIIIDPGGNIYLSTYKGYLRRISTDGIVSTITRLGGVWQGGGLSFGLYGDLYATYYWGTSGYIYHIDPDGTLDCIAGNGGADFSGDGGPALQAALSAPEDLVTSSDGSIYIADSLNYRIRKVGSPLPGFSLEEYAILSSDGSKIYQFDQSGKHQRTLNALTGNVILQFRYDDKGLLAEVEDGNGNITIIERDNDGNLQAFVSPYGQRTSLILNSLGYIESITDASGSNIRFKYTNDGLLVELLDANNGRFTFDYDFLGRLIREDDPIGGYQLLSRTSVGGSYTVTHSTALDRITTYNIDDLHYDGKRYINSFTDGSHAEVLINPDGTHYTTLPDNTNTYLLEGPDPRWGMQSPVDKVWEIATPGGLTFLSEMTRTAEISDPYDLLSLTTLTETLNQNGQIYTKTFKANDLTFEVTTPMGRVFSATIDTLGRVVSESLNGLYPLNYEYDTRGRVIIISSGIGSEMRTYQFEYDSNGYLSSAYDPLDQKTSFVYDSLGRIIEKKIPNGDSILYTYDANGNVTMISPPGRPNHFFEYTAVDMLAVYDPPDLIGLNTDHTQYIYNVDRQLTQIRQPDDLTIDFEYNSAGRLASLILPRGTTTFEYSPATGQLVRITTPENNLLSYTYDGFIPISQSWSGDINGTVTHNYNNDLQIETVSVDNNAAIIYTYDDDGLLVQVGDLHLFRDPQNGLLTGSQIGNISEKWIYNGFGEPIEHSFSDGNTNFYTVEYSCDKLGRITQQVESIDGITSVYSYTYDLVGRMTAVWKNGSLDSSYIYDKNGNRLSYSTPNDEIEGVYDNQDRLILYGNAVYTYTDDGKLRNKAVGGQITTYDFDAFGNLRAVSLPDGTEIDYVIDGSGHRIGKRVDGELVQGFLYQDALNPIAELDGTGRIVSLFVYGSKSNLPDYMIRNGAIYQIVSDHLGSPRFIIDTATRVIVQSMEYDTFGNVTFDTNPGFQPFGFAGGIYDVQTKFTHFGARDYDAETGRWTTKDPIGFAGGDYNLYTYVHNDPLNSSDSWGLYDGYDENMQIVNSARAVHDILSQVSSAGGDLAQAAKMYVCDLISPLTEMSLNNILNDIIQMVMDLGREINNALNPGYDATGANQRIRDAINQLVPKF